MNSEIVNALEDIRKSNGGMLLPEHVVTHARSPESPLHSKFQWDDKKCGEAWRLHQARELIMRVKVHVGPKAEKMVRAYVSVLPDRKEGGYRSTIECMSDPVQRSLVLQVAMREFETFRNKYNDLEELSPLFDAASNLKVAKGRATA